MSIRPVFENDVTHVTRESIRREVFEETGLQVVQPGCFGHASNPDYEVFAYPNGDRVHCDSLLLYSRAWQGHLITANEETLALAFFSPDELPEMTRNHRRTIEKYLLYKHTGRFQFD